ncbi:MAG: carbohydrate ABC transporter permease [Clostridiales bacterium]|jgi:putative aldouronate transport system permease protein|nr:carbohydrate ABC transporter permease [Clostridiales bacterium]
MGNKSLSAKLSQAVLIAVLFAVSVVMIIPILHVVASSFSSQAALIQSKFLLFPTDFSLDAYKYVFSTSTFMDGMKISLLITVAGTALKMLVTLMLAYALAHKDMPGRKIINYAVLITLVFSAGMIPNFITFTSYGLKNSLWALILPALIDPFNLIVIRSFIQEIPAEIEESAKIDGANDARILFSIIVPLSMATIATFSLFYAVVIWNSYFDAILYINEAKKFPVQVLLRQIILLSGSLGDSSGMGLDFYVPPRTVRMAVITAATAPILVVYPFLQKYFAKGVMLGSVKG